MQNVVTADRIVEIHDVLLDPHLRTEKREALMEEQTQLWDRDFPDTPYEDIASSAWLHKNLFKYGRPAQHPARR